MNAARAVPELDPRTWRALALLTGTLTRRFLREGLVLRSLVWPTALCVLTLLITLGVASLLQSTGVVALADTLEPELVTELEGLQWPTRITDDPEAMVRSGAAWAGTDGTTLWTRQHGVSALTIEAALRRHEGAPWVPVPRDALPDPTAGGAQGGLICRILAVLFALYGVVFGLGSVARDRDDGTLEAELSLPVPHWVPGLARWLSASALLTVFFANAVVLVHAILAVDDPWAMVRHGSAACAGATAIGLVSVGRAGIKQGFSGPLAAALTATTGGLGLGLAAPSWGQALPLASVFAGGSGWGPTGAAVAAGFVASAVFAARSARS